MDYNKLYNEIREYALKCINYNECLIEFYKLTEKSELKDYIHFILPVAAVKKGIIFYKDSFLINQDRIDYHVHGTGMTFTSEKIRYSFQYFPQIEEDNIPIFSISSAYDYVKSIYRNVEQAQFTEMMNKLVQKKLIIRIDEYDFSFYLPDLELSKNSNH